MNKKRPPIVVVLGHVDHGKTTLLDAIRNTSVQAREAGGITQSIGATKIKSQAGEFTFVDTPGHAAFSKMREHGTRVADIALLVVAADDGPMPQTVEAINYIRQVNIPFIVVLTKTDLPSANIEKALTELEKLGILFEGRVGNTPFVELSAKKNEGIDNLLEILGLLTEISEIKGDSKGKLNAIIIETNKDKRGVVVSAIVRSGTLKVGSNIKAGNTFARIRGLFNESQKPINEAFPGDPVLILGFSTLPTIGTEITSSAHFPTPSPKFIPTGKIPEVKKGQVAVVLKASTTGSLEALANALPQNAVVIGKSVGDVTDGDVFLAKAPKAYIMALESKAPSQVKRLAETEEVDIFEFDIIYELTKKLEELISSSQEKFLGKAEILATFPYNNQQIAGSRILEGEIKLGDKIRLQRREDELGTAKITSLKREKENITVAKAGEQCGILFDKKLDFEVGDMILSVDSK